MIGMVLGNRYEILEEIGSGGMANVYKAHCRLLNRMVAVKVLKKELEEDTEYLKRFNVEAQAAASLVHPNIVSIFDFGYDSGYHYIVMEMIDGITLKQYINDTAPMDCKDALGIAYQICDALSVAHQHNIVHRDIKPHNIMITSDHRVKVTDFGIARATVGSTMTADTSILGSVHYISPEQARGSVVDGRTDLYSLGVVLYEMLTGKVPFESDSPVAIAMKHIEEKPVNPREYNPEITYSVEQLVLKAMSKDINERYQKAGDFNRDIMKLLENPDAVIESASDEEADDVDKTLKIPAVGTSPESSKNSDDEKVREKDRDKSKPVSGDFNEENKKILIGAIATALVIVGLLSLAVTYVLYPEAPLFSMFAGDKIEVPDFYEMKLDEA
ncbi:MAG: Stk1 family PASTA domain-containing Ser/Thr kinase, partial [Clostridia bacterium]|nr:Stk1 family PASTA domain-containing Ser/Thr kinase [Clostridia bacterium]